MNIDKAYLLGLVIGGGIFGGNSDSFTIRLPYRQWGSIADNPARAGQIGSDIMRIVKPMFDITYSIGTTYDQNNRAWDISCFGDLTALKADLAKYKITAKGELRKDLSLSIAPIVADLVDDNLKRRFIAGLADTIGSTNKNHRRFTDDIQILSFEISGFNFSFVCELCRLLYSIKCYPDQVLWNHPNFHSASSPYYTAWKKGFKLRVELDQYAKFGAFAFKTKAESSNENRKLQKQTNEAETCEERNVSATSSCVHPDENYCSLLKTICGGHYLHGKHICAVLGCEHAPCDKINDLLVRAGEFVNPFPILYKEKLSLILSVIENDDLLKNRSYSTSMVNIKKLYKQYSANKNGLIYGDTTSTGYPLSKVIQAIAYLIAAHNGELNGNRIKGGFEKVIATHINLENQIDIEIRVPDLLTPLVFSHGEYGAMVGAENPDVYAKLIIRDANIPYKISVRKITEADLSGT